MFSASEEVFKKAAQLFGRTEETLNEDVETIKTWLKTQPHLPEIMEDRPIKNFLLLNKCSVEKTKQKIDMYYTIRSLIPDFYENSNPKLPIMQKFMETGYCVPFPKMVDGLYRVLLSKGKQVDTFAPYEFTKSFINISEIMFHEDYIVGTIYVFDMANTSLNDVMRITPTFLLKTLALYEKVYSIRIKNMYFINSSPFVAKLISVLKTIMKPKIFSRIHVSSDDSILKEIFPKDNLPRDYGGEAPSVEELFEKLKGKFVEYQDRFDKLDKMRVDESLRPKKLENDEVLGFHGNFKKLNVD